MILIADSGSTKTDWCLLNGDEKSYFQTLGLNPYFIADKAILSLIGPQLPVDPLEIDYLYFYGAGCHASANKTLVSESLYKAFSNARIMVYSDLLAVARALLHNRGIVVILGTGSNIGYYDGTELSYKTDSLGYVLGDEGSGAYIGRHLLRSLLYHELPQDITHIFFKEYNTSRDKILNAIYKEAYPNRYLAGFMPFIFKYKNTDSIKSLVIQAFIEMFDRHIKKYDDWNNLEMGFCGSVAWYFKDELEEVCYFNNINNFRVEKSPMEGLIMFHRNTAVNE